MSTDFIQIMRECLVSALDTAAAIVAITTRSNGNLVAWGDTESVVVPCVAYRITNANRSGGLGDERTVHVSFRAVAASEAQANELLGAVERALTFTNLKNAVPSVTAYRVYSEEDRVAADYDADVEAFVADFDAVLIADNPAP